MRGDTALHPVELLTVVAAAVGVGWLLHQLAWPLYAWLPAALLAAVGMMTLWVVVWFVARKISYPYLARKRRRELRESGVDITEL